MVCYFPLQGYRSKELTSNGKRKIVFSPNSAICVSKMFQVTVPCGQCIGCRLERSRQWAVRCMHESFLYSSNCFITLTYSPEFLPEHGTLVLKHFQDFMKRLRKRYGSGIRFFHAGEYGSKYGRPHYHAILFNHDFSDKVFLKKSNDIPLYRSASLEALWPFGHSSVGSVTFDSAAYVARYCLKKTTGDAALSRYSVVDPESGELIADIKPEYTTMSRRPGIASEWFKKFSSDVYPLDSVIFKGKRLKPPKYYDGLYEVDNEDSFNVIKARRKINARKRVADSTPDRLSVRLRCKLAALKNLPRNLDKDSNDF